jgi:hypothetical protein
MHINPTTNHRQGDDLVERAIAAQDAIGWAPSDDADQMGSAVLGLARQVTAMAREVSALRTAVDFQQTVIDGQAHEIARLKGEK